MSQRNSDAVANLCRSALERIDKAIQNHKTGVPEDLNVSMLENIRKEVLEMSRVLDKDQFTPSYGRYVLDWPDEHGLVEVLLRLAQEYRRRT